MQAVIHLQQVSKKYGEKQVLGDITQSFAAGSAIAFVGHNGCGKSTLLKVLSGLVRPTRGTVQYDRALIFHYVPEKFPATYLTAEQYLMHMGMIDGLSQARLSEELWKLAEEFHMAEHLRSRMSTLSKPGAAVSGGGRCPAAGSGGTHQNGRRRNTALRRRVSDLFDPGGMRSSFGAAIGTGMEAEGAVQSIVIADPAVCSGSYFGYTGSRIW